MVANSPTAVVTGEQVVANVDITLDTFRNTLPKVNPAGQHVQSGRRRSVEHHLRGFGQHRSGTDPSLYDVVGRRAYVSARVKF